jgi:hypothetical protein
MNRMFGFVIFAFAVLMIPQIAAQSPVQNLSPQVTPYAIGPLPPANNWLLSSWYCNPADCFDYVVAQEFGTAYTAAYGTPYGTPSSDAFSISPAIEVIAQNCTNVAILETGTATFRLTTKRFFTKIYDGGIRERG